MDVLFHTTNPFKGVIVERDRLPPDPATFERQLSHSIEVWKAGGLLTVWLEVPIGFSDLIPIGVKAGFEFHHAGNDYVMMTFRLVKDTFIPVYATHYIGAGGVVINQKDELLVVCERYRRDNKPSYKLPGGSLQSGEHLQDCVIREVKEETGIETIFDALVCFRHWHGYRFSKSDIYFVCRLRPKSQDITIQQEEIEECLWMPILEYLESEYVHAFNKSIVRAALESPGLVPVEMEGYPDRKEREFFMPRSLSFGSGTSSSHNL